MNFSFNILINRPPTDVFSWVDNPDKAMQWQKGVKGGTITCETPERIGTTFTEILEEDGRTLEMTGRITAYEPERSIAFHLESKIHTVLVNYTVEPEEEGCVLRIETDIRWKFPMSLMSLFMGGKIREGIARQTESELQELKRLCEGVRE